MEWIKVTEETVLPENEKYLVLCDNNVYLVSYICKAETEAAERVVFDYYMIIPKFHDQPERSKREDSQVCEMRCSEHCGNTVRDK